MSIRTALELFGKRAVGPITLLVAWLGLGSGVAYAQDDASRRFGLTGALGAGVADVFHPGPLPGVVGFSDLGVQIMGEIRPWGGFVRGDFLSSGDDGRWTAYSVTAGAEYRLFGDLHHTALFLRGGLAYERWIGNTTGCPIDIFVPSSCNLTGHMAPAFSTSTDMLGVVAGVRVELPIPVIYLAFGLNFLPTVGIDKDAPGGTLQLRFDLEAGFRDTRVDRGGRGRTPDDLRHNSEANTPFRE
jgi:hypothetical protein